MKKYPIAAIFVSLSLLYGCSLENDCSSGEQRCSQNSNGNTNSEICIEGFWKVIEKCDSRLCDGDKCLPTQCALNETECDQDKGLRTCLENKQWSEYTKCQAGMGCTSDHTKCAECLDDDDTFCENGALMYCIQGRITQLHENSSFCETCTDGETQCLDSNKYKTCQNGKWSEILCQKGETCSDGKCTATGCKAGEKMCSDGKIYTCNDTGKWDTTTVCEYNNCKSATECGECRNDSKTCINNHNYGELQVCINGTLTPMSCSTSCNAQGTECGQCVNDESKCTNNMQKKCVNGAWYDEMSCNNGCNGSACLTLPHTCDEGEKKCVDATAYLCTPNNQWGAGTDCQYGCSQRTCAPEPTPDADILDVVFRKDGTAINVANTKLTVTPIGQIQTIYVDKLSRFAAYFDNPAGKAYPKNYYRIDYGNYKDIQSQIEDGHSLEVLFTLDQQCNDKNTAKPFSSHHGGGTGFQLGTYDDNPKNIIFVIHVGGKYLEINSGIEPIIGQYYHVIGTWDKESGTAKIYENGVLKDTQNTSGNFQFGEQLWFAIGGDPYNATSAESGWNGKIAIARIYSNALSADEVKRLYNNSGLANTQ